MRTVAFTSYKGGQGRTLAAVNLANLLTRLGQHVLLLDMDDDSPGGVLAKYGRSVFTEPALTDDGLAHLAVRGDDPALTSPELIPIEMPMVPPAIYGSIRVVQLGSPVDSSYWRCLASPSWRSIASPLAKEPNEALAFWRNLRQGFNRLRPKPTCLLIDTPSGLSELATVTFRALADVVVLLVGREKESQQGAQTILSGLAPLTGERPPDVCAVDSRFPEYFAKGDDRGRRERGLLKLLDSGDTHRHLKSVLTLPALLGLEAEPRPTIDLAGPVELNVLNLGYFVLGARLFPNVFGYSNPPERVLSPDQWAEATTAVRDSLERNSQSCVEKGTHKVFILEPHGVMVNLDDGQRNVSFKVDTFCSILDDFHRDLLPSAAELPAEAEREFEQAGEVVGSRFGKNMLHDSWGDQSIEDRLQSWCRFDSDVGFGEFSLLGLEMPTGAFSSVSVWVEKNFLASGRDPDSADLCRLLVGYIRGVTSQLIGPDIEVAHLSELCMRHGSDVCVFDVTAAPTEGT